MYRLLILLFIFLFLPFTNYAENVPSPPLPKKDIEEIRQHELEYLKKSNPQEYEKRKQFYERQQKIADIINLFANGKISLEEAKRRLFTLVKEDIQAEVQTLDRRIEILEKELSFLKKAQAETNFFINSRINQMLGIEQDSYNKSTDILGL